MVSRKLRAYLLVAGFFVLGGVGGAAAGRAYTQREVATALFTADHQVRDTMFLDAITHELQLTEAQRSRVAELHQSHRARRRELMQAVAETCGKPLEELRAEMDAEMSQLLNASQTARWNELMAQRRQRRGSEPSK